jgi:hypothetical protein
MQINTRVLHPQHLRTRVHNQYIVFYQREKHCIYYDETYRY